MISTLFENLMAVYIGSSQTLKYDVFFLKKKQFVAFITFLWMIINPFYFQDLILLILLSVCHSILMMVVWRI